MVRVALVLLQSALFFSLTDAYTHYVSAEGGDDCPQNKVCHSLEYYLSDIELYFSSYNELHFLEGTHLLDIEDPVTISKVAHFTLSGDGQWVPGPEESIMESTAIIYCVKEGGGFSFIQSTAILIQGLSFINCGAYNYIKELQEIFYAALLFVTSSKVDLSKVSVQNSSGHGIMTYNSHTFTMISSSIAYSNINKSSESILHCNNLIKGTNLLFMNYNLNLESINIDLSKSNFTDGCGNLHNGGNLVLNAVNSSSVSYFFKDILVTQRIEGGGISVRHDQTGIHWKCSGLTIRGFNTPQPPLTRGLSIVIEDAPYTDLSSIHLHQVNIIDFSGEALYVNSCHRGRMNLLMSDSVIIHQDAARQAQRGVYIFTSGSTNNAILLQNITVSLGNAFTKGLVIEMDSRDNTESRTVITIQDSHFENNKNMKSVLKLSMNNDLNITNCVFSNNNGDGSVIHAMFNDHNLLIENTTIESNNMTALAMWSGNVQFYGKNVIQRNHNNRGAGIFAIAISLIYVQTGSELILSNNTADTVGGAIAVLENKASTHCTVLVSNDSRVIFSGNRAVEGGSDVYGGSLIDCLDIDKNLVPRQGRPNETSWYFNIPLTHTMHFSNIDKLSSLSSDPIMVCFCNRSGLPDCSKRLLSHKSLFPGEEVVTKIATVGYYGGTSSGTVSIAARNATLVRPYGPQGTTARCHKLHLLLQSDSPTLASVDITVNGGLAGWDVTLVVHILECPPGFEKNNQSGKCECAPLLKAFDISCIATHDVSYFQRSGNVWLALLNSSNSTCLTVYANCPFGYCNSSQVTLDLIDPAHQCTGGRTGILCGQCQPGLSLLLGSNSCGSCSSAYLLLVLVFALAGIALVAVIMALNLTVSAGTVNGLLLYANMVKLNESVFFPYSRPPVVSQFISWLNLDVGIEVCLYNGLDGYWKTWFQFAFPFYLFILMGAIIIGSQYSVRICRLCGSHAVPALATVFLMSYTKILQTVTNALSMSQLNCNDTMLNVWSVDGNINYFSAKHLVLVIFSSVLLMIGMAYPLLVLFAPLLERYSDKCFPCKWNPVTKLKPLLDAYGGPYRDRHRYWTGITLLVRLLSTVVFSFTSGKLLFFNSIIIAITVQAFFYTWLFTKGVYKNLFLNVLDSLFLLNLFALAIISLAFVHLNLTFAQHVATIVSTFLSLLGLLFIVIHRLWLWIRHRLLKKHQMSTQLKNMENLMNSRYRESCSNSSNKRPGSPPSHVYGTIRGEHQFDLHIPKIPSNSSPSSPVILREREPLLFSISSKKMYQ